MRIFRRVIAALLLLALLIGTVPAYAAESEPLDTAEGILTEASEEASDSPDTEAPETAGEIQDPETVGEAPEAAEEVQPPETEQTPEELSAEPEGEQPPQELPEAELTETVTEPQAEASEPSTEPQTAPPTEPQSVESTETPSEEPQTEPPSDQPTEPETAQPPAVEVVVPELNIPAEQKRKLSLYYDDRYSFAEQYPDYVILSIENRRVDSYQVNKGKKTAKKDTAVLQQTGDADVTAVGTGLAVVTLVPREQYAEAQQTLTPQAIPTTENATLTLLPIDAWQITVTVTPAKLTLFLLAGQSNAEGLCNGSSKNMSAVSSVSCRPGTVYSTYLPTVTEKDRLKIMTGGLKLSAINSSKNWAKTLQAWLPSSLTSVKALSGAKLTYPLNALTEDGKGKTGMDGALGYEWNRLTKEKVWVINAGWNGSSIRFWQPGKSCYERAKTAFQQAVKVAQAEISAGHYNSGRRIFFWLQGETDVKMKAETYTTLFLNLRSGLKTACGLQYFAMISVRAAYAKSSYQGMNDLRLTGPRLSQYAMAANAKYQDIYIVSNVNESWGSDRGVKQYFAAAYPSGELDYPMREGASTALPVSQYGVHAAIHFTQVGHNENGLTAARGMYEVIRGTAKPQSVQWRGQNGSLVQSVLVGSGKTVNVLAQVTPVTASKQVQLTAASKQVTYNADTCSVSSNNGVCTTLAAKAGKSKLATLSISGYAAPKGLKATLVKGGVQVKWSKVSGAQKYRVSYKTASGSWVTAGDTEKTSLVIQKGLKSGKEYTFTVCCVSQNGKTLTSESNRTGVSLTYYAPPILRSAEVSDKSVKLTWNKVGGVGSYRVYYKRPSAKSWTAAGDTSATSFTVSGLGKGAWLFTVRCLKADNKTPMGWYDNAGTKVSIS